VTRRVYTLRVTQGVRGRLTAIPRTGIATVTDEHGDATTYVITYYRADGCECHEVGRSGALRLGPVADHMLSIVTQAIRRGRHTTTITVDVGDDTAATAA
jgi:hypothetical protein